MQLGGRLTSILEAMVDYYAALPPDSRRPLLHHQSFQSSGFLDWEGDSMPSVTRDDLDDLHSLGLVDLDFNGQGHYLAKPSLEGRAAVRTLRRERARTDDPQPVDLQWSTVRPVLHATVDLWAEGGASRSAFVPVASITERLGVKDDDLATIRAVEMLDAIEMLDASYDDDDVLRAQPTTRGVMATRGWPGGDPDVAAERLLSVLDALASSAPDEETRGWAARSREALADISVKVLAEVIAKSAGNAL